MPEWMTAHGLTAQDLGGAEIDLQAAQLFPVCEDFALVAELLTWMLAEHPAQDLAETFRTLPRLSADDIAARADLSRQETQRCAFRQENLALLALHHDHSVFYQVDLGDMAQKFVQSELTLPPVLPEDTPLMPQIRDAMFRSRYLDCVDKTAVHKSNAPSISSAKASLLRHFSTASCPNSPCTTTKSYGHAARCAST